MRYTGDNLDNYMGVDKYIVVFWNPRENDYEEVIEMFTLDEEGLQEAKEYTIQARKEYFNRQVKLLKETWQGIGWSDYETIRVQGRK